MNLKNERKTTKTKTKQTKRTGRESEKGHHMEGFQCVCVGGVGGKGTGKKKHNW